jgi:cold-inducible RNA-binding protein
MRIYVGNLSFNTDEGTLEQLFAPLGAVESVKLIRDHATGRSRGFGFVEMADDAGKTACEQLDQHEFEGRRLTVNEAKPQERSGGGYGGGGGRSNGGGFGRPKREARW